MKKPRDVAPSNALIIMVSTLIVAIIKNLDKVKGII